MPFDVRMHMSKYIHAYVCMYIHTYIRTYIHTYTHAYVDAGFSSVFGRTSGPRGSGGGDRAWGGVGDLTSLTSSFKVLDVRLPILKTSRAWHLSPGPQVTHFADIKDFTFEVLDVVSRIAKRPGLSG